MDRGQDEARRLSNLGGNNAQREILEALKDVAAELRNFTRDSTGGGGGGGGGIRGITTGRGLARDASEFADKKGNAITGAVVGTAAKMLSNTAARFGRNLIAGQTASGALEGALIRSAAEVPIFGELIREGVKANQSAAERTLGLFGPVVRATGELPPDAEVKDALSFFGTEELAGQKLITQVSRLSNERLSEDAAKSGPADKVAAGAAQIIVDLSQGSIDSLAASLGAGLVGAFGVLVRGSGK